MIDVQTETVVTLREACERLPHRRAGRPTHPTTLVRWIDEGIDGIRLDGIRIGMSRCTSVEALQRFFEELTSAHEQSQKQAEAD